MKELRRCCQVLDQHWLEPSTPRVFISTRDGRLSAGSVHRTFPILTRLAEPQRRAHPYFVLRVAALSSPARAWPANPLTGRVRSQLQVRHALRWR